VLCRRCVECYRDHAGHRRAIVAVELHGFRVCGSSQRVVDTDHSQSLPVERSNEILSEKELAEIRARYEAATPGPWRYMAEGRDHMSGDSFIRTGSPEDRHDDLFLTAGNQPASDADYEFIANARQDIPRLLTEIERLRETPR